MFIEREASKSIETLSKGYPVIVLTGPRQSGKSTLARHLFPNYSIASFEDLDTLEFAKNDPRGFLAQYGAGAIIDEVQRCPEILSYIQTYVDEKKKMGLFILTGSAQLSLLSSVTQSLAGRSAIVHLLPFSYHELKHAHQASSTLNELLFKGSYPPIYDRKLNSTDWYIDYIQTYVERDVRQIIQIQELTLFQKFLKMCAARVGQLVNFSSLSNDCGITHSTASAWLNILEATYIIFRLQPHYRNFSKRLVKSPKLYFYDTGLLCSLLGIENHRFLETHAARGSIFENWVLSEMLKRKYNLHRQPNIYFWRDHKGNEIDLLIEHHDKLIPVEIKAGQTMSSDYFKTLTYWASLAKDQKESAWLIYAGEEKQTRSETNVLGWKDINLLLDHIGY